MGKTLGIFVSSDEHLDKIIRLCKAAKRKNVRVKIFLTHIGTRLCKAPRLKELEGLAELALCKVSFESNRLEKPSRGIREDAYSSQSWHAEMILECDRYVSF